MRGRRTAALVAVLVIVTAAATGSARPLDVIRDRGVLSLCAHANSLPFASKTQDPPGFQIELGRALAAALSVSLNVEWVTSRFQFRIADCDIVLDTIVLPGADADRGLQLSKPYQRSGVGLAVPSATHNINSFNDVGGRRVATQGRSVAAMLLEVRGARLVFFGYEDEMIEAVARGEVDVAAVSPATAGYFMLRHPDAAVKFVHAYDTEPELRWNLAVGLRRSDAPLREAIDAALDRLAADGTMAKIYSRYGIEYRPAVITP